MKKMVTYLTFDGACNKAMKFYQKCFGGDLNMIPFSEAPDAKMKSQGDRIMHSNLVIDDMTLMASDSMPGHPYKIGNTSSIYLECESMAEVKKMFASLSEGGKVTMPLADTFWGAHFGCCEDKFGVQWMMSFSKPQ
jgi:PhnB protein